MRWDIKGNNRRLIDPLVVNFGKVTPVRIKIIRAPVVGFHNTRHPFENRVIQLGDEFDVTSVNNAGQAEFYQHNGHERFLDPMFFEVVEEAKPQHAYKVGDQARLVAPEDIMRTWSDVILKDGHVFTITDVDDERVMFHYEGKHLSIKRERIEPYEGPHPCSCSVIVLMGAGCQCGGI